MRLTQGKSRDRKGNWSQLADMEALFQCGQAATELWTTDWLCEMMKQGWCGRCFSWPEFPFGCPTHPCACARNCTHTTKRENSQSAAVRPAATAVPQREERYEFYSSLGSTACLPARSASAGSPVSSADGGGSAGDDDDDTPARHQHTRTV